MIFNSSETERNLLQPTNWIVPACGSAVYLGDFCNSYQDQRFGVPPNFNAFHGTNDELYHYFTRSEDGMCDRCAWNYKQHECKPLTSYDKHKEFYNTEDSKDLFEACRQSSLTSVETDPSEKVTIVRYDTNPGEAIKALGLIEHEQLKLLAGEFLMGKEHKEFVLGKGAKIGLLYRFVKNTISLKLDDQLCKQITKFNISREKRFVYGVTHLVGKIEYGGDIMLMFDCDEDDVETVMSNVITIGEYLQGRGLDDEETQNIRFKQVSILSPRFGKKVFSHKRFRSLVKRIKDCKTEILNCSRQRGIPVTYELKDVRQLVYEDKSDNERHKSLNELTYVFDYQLNDFDPSKLTVELTALAEILENDEFKCPEENKAEFLESLVRFRAKLWSTMIALRAKRAEVGMVKAIAERFEEYSKSFLEIDTTN